jgi:dTDP-glucose 4,6-dehydratase
MDWDGKKVLVTGAGGFIGSQLVERLVDLGAEVIAIVRYNSKAQWGLLQSLPLHLKQQIKVVPCDLSQQEPPINELKNCHSVFHLASIMDVSQEYVSAKMVLENNYMCALNTLESVKGCKGVFINASTFEIYGEAKGKPTQESAPIRIKSPYVASKVAVENLLAAYCGMSGFKGINLRLFSTYGPRANIQSIIPTIIQQALKDHIVRLGIMDTQRDFIYVSDTVDGMIKLAESDMSAYHEAVAVNLGSGTPVSIAELAERVGRLIGKEVKIKFDPTRIRISGDDIPVSHADTTLLKEVTGWEPKVDLDRGLKETIAWLGSRVRAMDVSPF